MRYDLDALLRPGGSDLELVQFRKLAVGERCVCKWLCVCLPSGLFLVNFILHIICLGFEIEANVFFRVRVYTYSLSQKTFLV